MNPSNKDGWHSGASGPQPHPAVEQLGQQSNRPLGYGENLLLLCDVA
ncbi:hypothetical protein CISG_08233 [Coccidioides immitis RMSCC 3703]|uniref:Uncharacterized protein n=1 Tax=Coccidioides immitis RMSCC 3703 TaxID=454286 RepID=A0A0J8R580_COCIT|nr:hypothetical protein CISG_08233 [Coccidioides immitis RMSCC 3703]